MASVPGQRVRDRAGTVDAELEAICVLQDRTGFVVVIVIVVVVIAGIMLMSHQL